MTAWWDDSPLPPPGAFDDLCAAAGGGVRAGECRRATGGARALFSTRAHARDDVVFSEIPALLVQDPRNVASARACARCHALLDETPTPTACAQGCGVTYCDERCASEHFSSGGHRIACVGPLESYSHPVAALKLACAKDDDGDGLLALLTETVARCVARAEEDAAEEDGREPAGEGGGGFLRRAGAHWFVRGPSSLPAARLESYATLVSDALDAAARDGTCAEDAKRAVLGGDATRAVSELVGLLSRNQLSVVVAANKPAAAAAPPPAAAPSSPSSEPPPRRRVRRRRGLPPGMPHEPQLRAVRGGLVRGRGRRPRRRARCGESEEGDRPGGRADARVRGRGRRRLREGGRARGVRA